MTASPRIKIKARIPIIPLCNKLIYRIPTYSLQSKRVSEVQVRSPVAKNEFTWGARAGQTQILGARASRPHLVSKESLWLPIKILRQRDYAGGMPEAPS